jgi:tRNA-modifying protein YgfZ
MSGFLTKLPDLGIIEITGEDAASFLQGQFTSNLGEINHHQSAFSAWCNAQGRVIATFLVFRDLDRYLLLLPCTLIDSVCQRLRLFVLRSSVVISSQRLYTCIGLSGQHTKTISDILNDPEVFKVTISGDEADRIILVAPAAKLEELHRQLACVGVRSAELSLWQQEDNNTAIPWLFAQTSGEFLPQELNLEAIGALSYNKGCFPGQEIIARIHFRGRVKRSLCQGYIESSTLVPEPGTRIFTQPDANTVGMIINSVRVSDKLVSLLAVIDSDLPDSGQAIVVDSDELFHFVPISPRANKD